MRLPHERTGRPRDHRHRRIGGNAAFLVVLRRWLQRRQDKRQEQFQVDVRILEEDHALRQVTYQHEREALQALAEERERRHKAELLTLEAQMQMQAKLVALTRINHDLTRRLREKEKPTDMPPGTLRVNRYEHTEMLLRLPVDELPKVRN